MVLEGFLSEPLFDNIRIDQILESESNQEDGEDKVREDERQKTKTEFTINAILKGFVNQTIFDLRGSSIEEIDYLRKQIMQP